MHRIQASFSEFSSVCTNTYARVKRETERQKNSREYLSLSLSLSLVILCHCPSLNTNFENRKAVRRCGKMSNFGLATFVCSHRLPLAKQKHPKHRIHYSNTIGIKRKIIITNVVCCVCVCVYIYIYIYIYILCTKSFPSVYYLIFTAIPLAISVAVQIMLAGRNGHVVWEKGVCCSLVGRVWAWALIKPEDSTHSLSVG